MTDCEYIVEDEVCKKGGIAEALGWLRRKVKWIGRRNCPDDIFGRAFEEPCEHCGAHGRVLLIEFKRPGKKPNVTQKREIARLRAAGFEVHVVDNERDARRILR